jgi:hypothetical protein
MIFVFWKRKKEAKNLKFINDMQDGSLKTYIKSAAIHNLDNKGKVENILYSYLYNDTLNGNSIQLIFEYELNGSYTISFVLDDGSTSEIFGGIGMNWLIYDSDVRNALIPIILRAKGKLRDHNIEVFQNEVKQLTEERKRILDNKRRAEEQIKKMI